MSAVAPKPMSKQRGVLIVALMAGIAIMVILSTIAVQSWEDVIRRDNEAEMMFRAQDIVRALKRFQADRGKLPTELKEMMEPGQKGQFVLRRLWKDPLVKDGQWQLVYASPSGGLFDPAAATPPPPGGLAPPEGFSQTRPLGSDPGTQPGLGLGQPLGGQPGSGVTDPTGLPIAGVKSKCKEKPFRRYKEKDEYTDWVFSIFDLEPQGAQTQQNQQNQQNQKNQQGGATFPPTGTGGTGTVSDPNKQ